MRLPLLSLCALLAMPGCEEASFPPVPTESVPAPANPAVVVGRNASLFTIAREAYGHREFSGFLSVVNDIPNKERIALGSTLRTPGLAGAFREMGLAPDYQPAINLLAKASCEFYALLPSYLEARGASGVERGTFEIPPEIRDQLLAQAETIEAANGMLGEVKAGHGVPRMTIGQFATAATRIRELATGSIDGYGYDHDLVGQRLGRGFTNAILWAKSGHQ